MSSVDYEPSRGNYKKESPGLKIPKSLQNRIVEKIESNRVTILVGPTGCGKSTLVPQLLMDKIGTPILCTQPRRLAVVAVAAHVAEQRGTRLGDEVGYHVGQNRVAQANHQTGLLFATAGILLEELRSNGLDALSRYKVVIIDECHERSPESDLCLVIIKSFMRAHPRAALRVVLMSATFDQKKYTTYFAGVPGCEFIDNIPLQSADSIDQFYNRIETFYLEDIMRFIPRDLRSEYLDLFEVTMSLDPNLDLEHDNGKSLSHPLVMLIMMLVLILHKQEPRDDIFLIFAPTYRHLEQIYSQLSIFDDEEPLLINVLHSSIDIEDCIKSMKTDEKVALKGKRPRRILLASAIADSSVTIPGVSCVIDTARSLEVKWDAEKARYIPKTVWSSKAICDQRRGRTGRTNEGRVFRLLNQSFYNNDLVEWEYPKIQLASCRDEILSLLSSSSKVMSDPLLILEKCLDPPPTETTLKAIQYLKDIGACQEEGSARRSRLVPTSTGKLLAALPFTVADSGMIIRGAKSGLLHEAILLVAIQSTRPHPIVHTFGESDYNEESLRRYFRQVNMKDPRSVAIANFGAFLVWHVHWNKIRAKAATDHFLHCTTTQTNTYNNDLFPNSVTRDEELANDCNVWDWTPELEDAHIQWCKSRSINPTSVRAIAQSIDITLKTLYHADFEPEWIRCQEVEPKWNFLGNQQYTSTTQNHTIFDAVYGSSYQSIISHLTELQDKSSPHDSIICNPTKERLACIHFLKGNCKYGDRCSNAHSYSAPRPPCRFFRTTGCSSSNCLFSHEYENVNIVKKESMVPTTHGFYEGGPRAWFINKASTLLLFGEGDFTFTRALSSIGARPAISTTSEQPSAGIGHLYCDIAKVDATRCHANRALELHPMNHRIITCAWNFPFSDVSNDNEANESLMCGAFMSVADYFKKKSSDNLDNSQSYEFGLALQGDQFCRWSILRIANQAGFIMRWWDSFDSDSFPNYMPKRANGNRFPAEKARFYVFELKR